MKRLYCILNNYHKEYVAITYHNTLVFGCMAASRFLRSVQSTNEDDTPNLETTRRKYLLVPYREKIE